MASTPITELDFTSARAALRTYLQSQDQLKDYNYDGSNLAVLLDILAYNTHLNNFYANMVHAEAFMDSAQLPASVISHAKHLNYLPGSVTGAHAELTIELTVGDDPSYVTIPKYTTFSTTINGTSYVFNTVEAHAIYPANGQYTATGIPVVEGRVVRENVVVTGSGTQRFLISNENVDITTVEVSVRETTDSSSANTEYTRATNLFGLGPTDAVFFIQPYDDTHYEIVFGKGVFGVQPSAGNVVQITYLNSIGEGANGIHKMSVGNIGGYAATVTVTANAEGGSSRESIESIRYFAPRSIQVQDRAVTARDYKILLQSQFSEIQAVAVYGGEDVTPPQYGRVVVAVDVAGADGVSNALKTKYEKYLSDRSPIGIEPIVVAPEFMYIDVVSTVYYNTTTTAQSAASIATTVRTAIDDFSDTYLADFGKTVRASKLFQAIDDSDVNIVSNDTELRAIYELNPTLNTTLTFTMYFNNTLKSSRQFDDTDSLSTYQPAIRTSAFTYNSTQCFIVDDGIGALHIVQQTSSNFVYIKRDIGTVDYQTGKVVISNLAVQGFQGSAIKVYAKTASKDITAPDSRIVSIRSADVTVNVVGVTS